MNFKCPLCNQEKAHRAFFDRSIIVCKCQGLTQVGKIVNGSFQPVSFHKKSSWSLRKLNNIDSILEYGKKFNNSCQNHHYVKNYYQHADIFILYKDQHPKYMLITKEKKIQLPKKVFLSGEGVHPVDKEDINDLFSFLTKNKILKEEEKTEYLKERDFDEF